MFVCSLVSLFVCWLVVWTVVWLFVWLVFYVKGQIHVVATLMFYSVGLVLARQKLA